MRLIRFALLLVAFFLTLGLVVAIGGEETGPAEKIVLLAGVVGLVSFAAWAGRLGRAGTTS